MQRAGSVILSKHLTHYDPRSGSLYYNTLSATTLQRAVSVILSNINPLWSTVRLSVL